MGAKISRREVKVKYEQFLSIIAKSPIERGLNDEPVTLTDIAHYLELNPATVSNWNRRLGKDGQNPMLPPMLPQSNDAKKLMQTIKRIDRTLKRVSEAKPVKEVVTVIQEIPKSIPIPEPEPELDDPELYTDPKKWLKRQLPIIFKSLVAECVKKGNPNAIKLVCELVDPEYKQKQTEETPFNAGYITRLILEAEREANGRPDIAPDNGNGQVQERPPLLSLQIHKGSG